MALPAIAASVMGFMALSSLIAKLAREEELTAEEIAETERLYAQMGYGEALVAERAAEIEQEYAPQTMATAAEMQRTASGMRDTELGLATGSPLDRLMAITGKSREQIAARLDPTKASGVVPDVSQQMFGRQPPLPPVSLQGAG
jgi:hypothetical protein